MHNAEPLLSDQQSEPEMIHERGRLDKFNRRIVRLHGRLPMDLVAALKTEAHKRQISQNRLLEDILREALPKKPCERAPLPNQDGQVYCIWCGLINGPAEECANQERLYKSAIPLR